MTLGHVSRPNGLRGAVVLQIDPSMIPVLARGLEVELVRPGSGVLRTRVRSAAPVRGGVRVTFDDVGDRNASEALVGANVLVDRGSLGLAEDEYLDVDLVGLEVVAASPDAGDRAGHPAGHHKAGHPAGHHKAGDPAGHHKAGDPAGPHKAGHPAGHQLLGRLEEVVATGANDVYVVRTPDGREVLVPAVEHAVLEIDLDARRMTVAADALEYGQPEKPDRA